MTTKKQEQEALDKIREILEGLDRDSWLNWAFDGCVEMAQRNLDEDSANSMKEQRDNARTKVEELESDVEFYKGQMDYWKQAYKECRESKNKLIDTVNGQEEKMDSLWEKIESKDDKIDEQAQTIIELKAELYDYMKKEAE